jgi:phage portal protein BeeE
VGRRRHPVDYTPDQILHWHGEHPLDPRIGISHLDTLRDVVAEDAALQQATVELANSGLTEPTWVYRPLDAPVVERRTRARASRKTSPTGPRSSRKPVVLEEGMELRASASRRRTRR